MYIGRWNGKPNLTMADKPNFEEVEQESDPVGDVETRKVQAMGRVDIRNDFLDQIGVEEEEKVFVICDEDQVRIMKATAENMRKNA